MENSNIKVFNNLAEASTFFEEELFFIQPLTDIVNAYKNTFGGCSCNRGRRVNNANNVYKIILDGLEEKHIIVMKEKLKTNKVIFKISENEIVKEF